eukprot:6178146-Pleurochrysis_carterae.AAC.5
MVRISGVSEIQGVETKGQTNRCITSDALDSKRQYVHWAMLKPRACYERSCCSPMKHGAFSTWVHQNDTSSF